MGLVEECQHCHKGTLLVPFNNVVLDSSKRDCNLALIYSYTRKYQDREDRSDPSFLEFNLEKSKPTFRFQDDNTASFEYARSRGWFVGGSFFDDVSVAGLAFDERPAGKLLLAALQEVPLSAREKYVIVPRLSRLGAGFGTMRKNVARLCRAGLTIQVLIPRIAVDSKHCDYHCLILGLLEQAELAEERMVRSRSQKAVDAKFRSGQQTCRAVYGWDIKGTGRFRVDSCRRRREIRELVDNPEEQKWIRHMKQRRDTLVGRAENGNAKYTSYDKIAEELNQLGVPTKGGSVGTWSGSRVESILNCRHVRERLFDEDH